MKKCTFAVLLLMLCAAPAFARHKKPAKDPRVGEHPKAQHEKNENFKHATKHKLAKHKAEKHT
jgi:hypothetical protein